MISPVGKKILLLKKIEILEKKLIDYTPNDNLNPDSIYESQCINVLLILNFLIFAITTSILTRSIINSSRHMMVDWDWISPYTSTYPTTMMILHLMIFSTCLLVIFYSGKTCYNIWYSDYYSNGAIAEKLININNSSLPKEEKILCTLNILKSSILKEEEIPDIEFENILNLLNFLILKFY